MLTSIHNKIVSYWHKASGLLQFGLGDVEYPVYQGSKKIQYGFISEKMII